MIRPQPKPRARLHDRIAAKRARERKALAFRLAVLTRDENRCRHCSRRVRRTMEAVPERAEVHHRHGRNVRPEDRFTVSAAVTLCLFCHRDPAVIARFREGRRAGDRPAGSGRTLWGSW